MNMAPHRRCLSCAYRPAPVRTICPDLATNPVRWESPPPAESETPILSEGFFSILSAVNCEPSTVGSPKSLRMRRSKNASP